MKQVPQFLILDAAECREVLARNHIGRLAFIHGSQVDIEPIGYVARGSWLFMRSAYGTKIEALSHTPYVAIEVDEVTSPLDWRSVVAHGTIYMLPADGGPVAREQRMQAVEALRELIPAAFTEDDPTPERQIVYGMHVDRMIGRMAQHARDRHSKRPEVPRRPAPTERKGPNGF